MVEGLEGIMENRRLMRTVKGYSGSDGIHILAIEVADERGFSLMNKRRKYMVLSLLGAKRHFGYLADERLKPKCPFGTLRSSATLLSEMAVWVFMRRIT